MSRKPEPHYVFALDVGTSKVAALVGEITSDGRLQVVLSEFEEPPLPVHIVHSEGRNAAAKVRSFIDFAVAKLRADPLIN